MKVPLHIVKARRAELADLLRRHQYLPLAEVCTRLGVSEATARRDLSALQQERAITRTHGGAIYEYNQSFPSFQERRDQQSTSKQRIAEAAYKLIKPTDVVWLDGGTTCYAIASLLATKPVGPLTIVTNNLPAAERLADNDDVAVHISGGQYFRRSGLLVPGKALDGLRAWNFDLAFLGAEGLTPEGLWNSIADVVNMQRAVAACARRAIYCVDSTKIGKRAEAFLAPIAEVEHLLSDAPLSALKSARIRMGARRLIAA
ncbi:MAG: DeoR/GlpR family DNA-binding transcription regulator [Deltaproteobacteria bacterium]|nr:DeoR/GlpR family DNA-binding transcription regulator [Deltaproteobacteria bacterium]